MSDHLPECDWREPCLRDEGHEAANHSTAPGSGCYHCGDFCICDRLRACEQRVAAETISRLDRWQQHSPLGRKTYEEGVQAARDAVAALAPSWAVKFYVPRPSNGEWIGCNGAHQQVDVLAAIDALKEDK